MHGTDRTATSAAILFGVASIALIVGGYLHYTDHVERSLALVEADLTTIGTMRSREIENWRGERLKEIRLISSGTVAEHVVTQISLHGSDVLKWEPRVREIISGRLAVWRDAHGYQDLLLFAPGGKLLLSSGAKPSIHVGLELGALIQRVLTSRSPDIGDIYRCPECGDVHLDIAAPILTAQGEVAALLVQRIDPGKQLFPLVQVWPTPSATAETLLSARLGEEVVLLNSLRHSDKPPLSFKIPLSRGELPAVQAALGTTGIFRGKDYRGVDVMAVLLPVPGSTWNLVSKIDMEEVSAPLAREGRLILLVVLFGMLAMGAMAVLTVKTSRLRLQRRLVELERSRREQLEEIRVTLYSIGDAVIATDRKGGITRMNHVAEQLTGWLERDAVGRALKDVFRIVNEETREEVESPVERVLREGTVVGLANHTILIAADGTERPIADSGAPIFGESGGIDGVVLVFRDQTKEREAERSLYREELKFTALFQNLSAACHLGAVLDDAEEPGDGDASDYVILDVNPAFEALMGLTRVEAVGQRASLVFGSSPPPFMSAFSNASRGAGALSFDAHEPTLERHLSVTVVSPGAGTFAALYEDVTERKTTEQALVSSEEKFSKAFMASPDAMFITTVADGVVVDANVTAERMSGYSVAEMIGRSTVELGLWHTPSDRERYIAEVRARGRVHGFDTTFQHRDGVPIPATISGELIKLPQGMCFLSVVHDLTEQKRLEAARERAAKRLEAMLQLMDRRDGSEEELIRFAVEKLVSITDSSLAFIGRVDEAQASMHAHLWSEQAMKQCSVDGAPTNFDVLTGGAWAEAVRNLESVVINDFSTTSVPLKGTPQGHAPLTRFMAVPAVRNQKVALLAGLGNKKEPYDESDVREARLFLEGLHEMLTRKRAEQALKESAERLRQTVVAGEVGIWEWDIGDNSVIFSDEWKKQIGFEADELPNRFEEWQQRVHPDDHDRVIHLMGRACINPEERYMAEYRFRHKDGSYRWIMARADTHLDEQGKPDRMLGVHVDITKLKEVEAALEAERGNLRAVMDSAPIPLLVFTDEMRAVLLNDAARQLLGEHDWTAGLSRCGDIVGCVHRTEDEAGCGHSSSCSSCDLNRAIEGVARGGEAVANVEAEMSLRRGEATADYWFVANVRPLQYDGRQLAVVSLADITERKVAELELQASERRLRELYEESPLGYHSLDSSGTIIDVNPRWCELMGYAREEVLGRWFGDLLAPEDVALFRLRFSELKERGKLRAAEYRLVRKNGRQLEVSIDGRFAYNPDGTFRQTHCLLRDVTEERRAQREQRQFEVILRQQQRLESIGTLASGVAHEINNPLNVILNYAQLINDGGLDDYHLKDFSGNIVKESERMAVIVRNLLSFARQEKETHSPANVGDIVEHTLSLTRTVLRKDNIKLNVDVDDGLPKVKCRSQQIQQVVMNLITNARDALNERFPGMDERKRIEVGVGLVDKGSASYVRVSVRDFGRGIRPEVAQRIFDPFFTTKARDKGTGLGLSISYGIVKEHGGDITFESVTDQGSVFRVDLRVDNGWRLT